MTSTSDRQLKLLAPYLIGERPRDNGEWDMICPLHEDEKRSASLNVDLGVWYCQAECGGGRVSGLIKRKRDWVDPPASGGSRQWDGKRQKNKPLEVITEAKVQGWAAGLQGNAEALQLIMDKRGVSNETLNRFDIGWDRDRSVYTIPVRSIEGELLNIRRYTPAPGEGRRKIWGVTGYNQPHLFPVQVLAGDPKDIIICEGEWDALLTIQKGFSAVTRTAAAKVWSAEWADLFAGKRVFLCHDMDKTGQAANRVIGRALEGIAEDIRVVKLPYEVSEKHGKDLSDYWLGGATSADFAKLMHDAAPFGKRSQSAPRRAKIIDASDAANVGKPLKMEVTIKAKAQQGFTVPTVVEAHCDKQAGDNCAYCPMFQRKDGIAQFDIKPADPVVFSLIEAPKTALVEVAREKTGAIKCNRFQVDPREYMGVERLYARASIDQFSPDNGETLTTIKITSAGRHDTPPNTTVEVVGALYPHPKTQANEFLAWDLRQVVTSLDKFEPDDGDAELLRRFQGKNPLRKAAIIADEVAEHVTNIYGRREMHMAMMLTFHSAISFYFDGQYVHRGWLDLLVVGDTRTGKSEVAKKLMNHYNAGEMVNCESASFAGIIGGLQQYGGSKEWAISWGAVPQNDRRLVALDEVGGLKPDEIAQMSGVRSSGEAQLSKIQSDSTLARTRLIWMGNPRDRRMNDYTYGVQAIQPLIGNAEDIARFDLAMAVTYDPDLAVQINKSHKPGKQIYNSEACSRLIQWVWSRTADQVHWARGAEQAVYAAALDLGSRYVEDPPLIQAANVRTKVARIAVAFAAMTYSTTDGRAIVVNGEHVKASVKFLDRIYSMNNFGYKERSAEKIADRKAAESNRGKIKRMLKEYPGLSKFLRSQGKFRRVDIEEVLNMDRSESNAVINRLWEARMVWKDKGDLRVEPTLHELLREVQ